MSTQELLSHLAGKCSISEDTVNALLRELAEVAVSEITACNVFEIPGIVVIVKSFSKERRGRNPQTGEDILIRAKTVVRSRTDNDLRILCGDTEIMSLSQAQEVADRWRAAKSFDDLADLHNRYISHQTGKPIKPLLKLLGPWTSHEYNGYFYLPDSRQDGWSLALFEDKDGNLETFSFK
jgi:DNA-binding protein HU-beta